MLMVTLTLMQTTGSNWVCYLLKDALRKMDELTLEKHMSFRRLYVGYSDEDNSF